MKYEIEELMPVVYELCGCYTGKASTSVTYEKAQQIMGSVIYCIEELEDKDMLIDKKIQFSAQVAYRIGYERVLEKVQKARLLYNRISKFFNSYGNVIYENTFKRDIPAFFRWYDPKFNAQDFLIFLDYPILGSLEKYRGVDRILKYLEYIEIEQQFLSVFSCPSVQEIHQNYYFNYKEEVINICRLPLRHTLKYMVGEIYEENIENVNEKKIISCFSMLVNRKYQGNQEMMKYLNYDLKDYIVELKQIPKEK